MPDPQHPKNENDYALVVGIDHYPGYENLKGAIDDARDMARWLCDESDGGNLLIKNCKAVYSVPKPAHPIQDEIDDALMEILRAVGNKEPARRLYVYFSGHGMAPSKLVTGMCVANWSLDMRNRALNSQKYLDVLLTSGKFREVVMFLDCCRVRMVAAEGQGPANPNLVPGAKSGKSRSFLANATEFLNKAYEAVVSPPGGANPPGAGPVVRGYFTRALLEGLRGAAAVPPAGVPASELKKYLEWRTPELALKNNIEQEPEIMNGLSSIHEPVFGSAKPPAATGAGHPAAPTVPQAGTLGVRNLVRLELRTSRPGTQVRVLGERQRVVFEGTVHGSHQLKLPRGRYKIHGQHAEHTVVLPIRLDKPSKVHVFSPRLYTSAPLEGRPSSHEYYTGPSVTWSKKETRPPLTNNPQASIFVFVRAPSLERYQAGTKLGSGLVLLDAQHRELSHFADSETVQDLKFGWLAFNARTSSGTYYLRYSGTPSVEVPIQFFSGYQSQIFLMHHDRPLIETMKIFMSSNANGFQPRDEEALAVDAALIGLQNNADLLSDDALDLLLKGKFHNPMLGLVGAHVLIKRSEDRQRVALVLRNLRRQLPNSIDVSALELAARSREVELSHPARFLVFSDPPMLRAGLDAVIAASASRATVIARDSAIPQIAPWLYAESPWSSWQPVWPALPQRRLHWVHLAVLDEFKKSVRAKGAKKRFDSTRFARQIGVPPQTVALALDELKQMPQEQVEKEVPAEFHGLALFSEGQTKLLRRVRRRSL